MRRRLLVVTVVLALVGAVAGLLRLTGGAAQGQTAVNAGPAPRTAWGDPDLQGIWTDPYQTPLQRPPQFANKESFTDEERAALDQQRAGILRRDQRVERGSERDVAGAYNAVFQSVRPTGKRTSLVVDPPDGRIPALDRRGDEEERGGARVQARAAAAHRDVQEQGCGLRRRQVRAGVAATERRCLLSTTRVAPIGTTARRIAA